MEMADRLIANFGRIATASGGSLELIETDAARIRVRYSPGDAAQCAAGTCVLPHDDMAEMMREWLSRLAPEIELVIEPVDVHPNGQEGS